MLKKLDYCLSVVSENTDLNVEITDSKVLIFIKIN